MKIVAWAIVFLALVIADAARLIAWRFGTGNPSAADYPIVLWISLLVYGALEMVLYFTFNK